MLLSLEAVRSGRPSSSTFCTLRPSVLGALRASVLRALPASILGVLRASALGARRASALGTLRASVLCRLALRSEWFLTSLCGLSLRPLEGGTRFELASDLPLVLARLSLEPFEITEDCLDVTDAVEPSLLAPLAAALESFRSSFLSLPPL